MSKFHLLLIVPVLVLSTVGCKKISYEEEIKNTISFQMDGTPFTVPAIMSPHMASPAILEDRAIDITYSEQRDSIIATMCPDWDGGLGFSRSGMSWVAQFRMAIPLSKASAGATLDEKDVSIKLFFYTFSPEAPYEEYYIRYNVLSTKMIISTSGLPDGRLKGEFVCTGRIDDGGKLGYEGQSFIMESGSFCLNGTHSWSYRDMEYNVKKHDRKKLLGLIPKFAFNLTGKGFVADDGFSSRGSVCVDYNSGRDSVIVYAEPSLDELNYQRERNAILDRMAETFNAKENNKYRLDTRCILSYRMAIPVSKIAEGASLTEKDVAVKMFWYAFFSDGAKAAEYSIPYAVESVNLSIKAAGLNDGDSWNCDFSCSGHVDDLDFGLYWKEFSLENGNLKCKFPSLLDYSQMWPYTYKTLLEQRKQILG